MALDRIATEVNTRDLIVNLFGFAALGPLVMLALGRRLSVVAVIAIAASVSLSIEVLQVAIPGRNPSLTDFLLNVTGASLGASFLYTRVGRSWMAAVGRAFLAIS
jgi:VanZ family protein